MSRAVVQRSGGRGRGCHKFVPVPGGDGTKISSTGGIFDQSPGEISSIRSNLADHVVGDHVVLFPEGVVLVTSPGTESSYPRPPPIVETLDNVVISLLIIEPTCLHIDINSKSS